MAARSYGFKVAQKMIPGLPDYMDHLGFTSVEELVGRATPKATDQQYLSLNYTTKAVTKQDACIKSCRCCTACEGTSHQAIGVDANRPYPFKDGECVACNLCVDVCPVDCITMKNTAAGRHRPPRRPPHRCLCQLGHAPEQPDEPRCRI